MQNQPDDQGSRVTCASPPLSVTIGPLRSFCEVNFDGDSRYRSIELQFLEFLDGRRGYLVTLWRHDNKLDVYFESQLRLDSVWWRTEPALADIPMGKLVPTRLRDVRLTAGAKDLDASVRFEDDSGRTIELDATTKASPSSTRRLFVPSVLRSEARLLRSLYLFELGPLAHDDFVEVRIGGVPMVPTRWPWPIGFRRSLQARHGDNIVLLGLNTPGPISSSGWKLSENGTTVGWDATVEGHEVMLEFDPPIACVCDDGTVSASAGQFFIRIDSELVTRGRYETWVAEAGQPMRLALRNVSQSWRPPTRDFSVLVLEAIRRLKARTRSWEWNGSVVNDGGGSAVEGKWTRT